MATPGPFYLLGDPWIDRRDRGKTTSILYGSDDPHEAVAFADTTCLTECGRCNVGLAMPGQYAGHEVHRRDAEWIVAALNFAVHHKDGPGHPPSSRQAKEIADAMESSGLNKAIAGVKALKTAAKKAGVDLG